MRILSHFPAHKATTRAAALRETLVLVTVLAWQAAPTASAALQVTLLSASFDTDADGFVFETDAFGTIQPGYAGGAWMASGGFGSTGGLQVTLGGVDANPINDMSGGWSSTFNLASDESGVTLSFRYKLDQPATYEYDEHTRMLVKVDGVQYGRGSKNYVDHIGGDGSSTLGNSSSFLPTTDWQQHQIFVGDLAAGTHTIVLGGYSNKKDASDESSTATVDDVLVTAGNSAPAVSRRRALPTPPPTETRPQAASTLRVFRPSTRRARRSSASTSPSTTTTTRATTTSVTTPATTRLRPTARSSW